MSGTPLSPERRAFLAEKGRTLYGKYCGTKGRGICCESFAQYHFERGEDDAVRDLLLFLRAQLDRLMADDPRGEFEMTRNLIARITTRGWVHRSARSEITRDTLLNHLTRMPLSFPAEQVAAALGEELLEGLRRLSADPPPMPDGWSRTTHVAGWAGGPPVGSAHADERDLRAAGLWAWHRYFADVASRSAT